MTPPDTSLSLRRVIEAAVAGQISIAEAVTAAAEVRAADDRTHAERTAEESARLLALFDRFGGGRDAAAKAARSSSKCPHEREIIAQRIRRLARKREQNEQGSFAARAVK